MLKRGQIVLLWVAGLWTVLLIAGGPNLEGLGAILAGWVVCALIWVTLYRRAKKDRVEEAPAVMDHIDDAVGTELHKYYGALGLKCGATQEEMNEAYRDMVEVWRADRFNANPRLQEKALIKMRELNEAYDWLNTHIFGKQA